jgi:chromosomal replication initiation ATPase DnaA
MKHLSCDQRLHKRQVDSILLAISEMSNISYIDIKQGRKKPVRMWRDVAMFIATDICFMSYKQAADAFGMSSSRIRNSSMRVLNWNQDTLYRFAIGVYKRSLDVIKTIKVKD